MICTRNNCALRDSAVDVADHLNDLDGHGEAAAGAVGDGQAFAVGRWIGGDPLRIAGVAAGVRAAAAWGWQLTGRRYNAERDVDAFGHVVAAAFDGDFVAVGQSGGFGY